MVSKSKLDQVWRLFLGDLVWEPSLKWLHSWYFGQWNCKTTPNDLAEKKPQDTRAWPRSMEYQCNSSGLLLLLLLLLLL
jgi:hypothetical protein